MGIRTAVFPAAGYGTRILPVSKALPKEMVPVVDKPVIQWVVEEAIASGISQIIVVTNVGKRAIEDHFDASFELEHVLEAKGNSEALAEIRRIADMDPLCYVRQKEPLGLGHAVLITKDLVGPEPFAVFLPDDVIAADVPCLRQMLDVYERFDSSVVAVERVPRDEVNRYGVIAGRQLDARVYQVTDLVEKPAVDEAPSDLAIIGRYILTPEIFVMLERTPSGQGRELQLTDALRLLLERQAIYAYEFEGTRYDCGSKLGLLKANVAEGLRHPELAEEFRQYLRSLDLSDGRLGRAAKLAGDGSPSAPGRGEAVEAAG